MKTNTNKIERRWLSRYNFLLSVIVFNQVIDTNRVKYFYQINGSKEFPVRHIARFAYNDTRLGRMSH